MHAELPSDDRYRTLTTTGPAPTPSKGPGVGRFADLRGLPKKSVSIFSGEPSGVLVGNVRDRGLAQEFGRHERGLRHLDGRARHGLR